MAVLCALLALSCDTVPQVNVVSVPEVRVLKAVADSGKIILVAELDGDPNSVSECGFLFGKAGGMRYCGRDWIDRSSRRW